MKNESNFLNKSKGISIRNNPSVRIKNTTAGITLIALVVTIIVLLILAGISIQMLTGDNGILNRAGEAKEKTERAQFYEAAVLAYKRGEEPTLDEVVAEMRKDGYRIDEDTVSGTRVTGVTISNNSIGVEKDGSETVDYTVQTETGDTVYLAVINGKKYEMTLVNDTIIIDEEVYTGNAGGAGDTITVTATTTDTTKATATANEAEGKITINGLQEGNDITLKVTAGGRTFDVGKITVRVLTTDAPDIYIGGTKVESKISLDGAILLSAGANNNVPSTTENAKYIWESSNPSAATVTSDGIVMCGTEPGETTITLKGKNSTSKTCTISTSSTGAKKVSSASTGGITIPEGFTPINTNDAKWVTDNGTNNVATGVNNGLVIMDDRGNQFVWVPVPLVKVDSRTSISVSGVDLNANPNTSTPMAVLQSGSTTDYEGVLYTFSGTISTYQSGYKLGSTSYREPDVLRSGEGTITSSDYGDFTRYTDRGYNLLKKYITGISKKENNVDRTEVEIKKAWTDQLNETYKDMVTKVDNKKGFWVGRYETSYDERLQKAASIAGARSRTADAAETTGMRTWYGLYQKQKDFSSGKRYTSSMIWGSQYDAMLNWMAKNGETVGTNDPDKRNGDSYYITGSIRNDACKNDKWNNVFDLEGCAFEWTQEACYTDSRVFRRRLLQLYLFTSVSRPQLSVYCGQQLLQSSCTLYVDLNAQMR